MPGDWMLDLEPVVCSLTNEICPHPLKGCDRCEVKEEINNRAM